MFLQHRLPAASRTALLQPSQVPCEGIGYKPQGLLCSCRSSQQAHAWVPCWSYVAGSGSWGLQRCLWGRSCELPSVPHSCFQPALKSMGTTRHAPKLRPVRGPCSASAPTSLMKSGSHEGRRHMRRNVRCGQSWRRCGGRCVCARRRSAPKGVILSWRDHGHSG